MAPPRVTTQLQPRAQLERLLSAGLDIFAEHTLGGVLQRVADAARDIVGARYAALGVLNEQHTALVEFVTSGLTATQRDRIGALPSGHGLLGVVIRDPRPVRIADIQQHAARYGFPSHHPAMRSFLGVPIMAQHRVFGNLYLTEKQGADEFSAEDERIAMLLARKAGVAIENARLMQQLREFQSSRDRFYAMMNHELRNALTGVYGWLDLLVRGSGKSPPPAALHAMEAAEDSVQLLNDLLDLSRLDAGRLRITPEEAGADSILAEALRTVGPMADSAGVRLEIPAIHTAIPALVDCKRVRQILVNLLRNAIQHSPPTARVEITVRATDETLSFCIADQGPGIAPERHEQVFNAYVGSQQEIAGTGLALTLSRRLARMMGGEIALESTPGNGSTFMVRIPRFPARADRAHGL